MDDRGYDGSEPGDLTWPWNLGFSERDWIVIVCFVAFLVLLAKWPGGNRRRRQWPARTTSARLFDVVRGRRNTGE